jgi:hypothetical protein
MALISPGRAWWLARRDWQRGPAATWHDYVTCDRLPARWRNPADDLPPEEIPVCLLTGRADLRCALWMLASWFHFTRRNWRLFVHDDGTLRSEDAALLRRLFPHAVVRGSAETDRAMEKILRSFPAARAYRAAHVLARKAFDIPALSAAGPFIVLDSDLLFFAEPREILDWVDARPATCWFNQDVAEACELADADVFRQYGFHLWPRVNSGLCLLQSEAIDLTAMERWLTENRLGRAPGTLWRVEQTLLALAASRLGRGGLLPPAYEVSLGRSAGPGCVMRHYVGAVRSRFFGEGIARLAPILLAA